MTCLVGTGLQAQVSPLRPGEESITSADHSVMAPLLDEWVRQVLSNRAQSLWRSLGDDHPCLRRWRRAYHDRDLRCRGYLADVVLSSSPDPLYNVKCVDANICIAIGNSATTGRDIYRTTNAGATWQRLTNFPLGGSWDHLDFVSPTVGFMGSNGATARTTDAGATWTLRSGFPSCPVMYGMDFRDASVGLCGGERVSGSDSGPGIFKTSDAGVTWVRNSRNRRTMCSG